MNTPQMVELRNYGVILIKQSESNFMVLDSSGFATFSYEGRQIAQSKYSFPLSSLQTVQIGLNSKHSVFTGRPHFYIFSSVLEQQTFAYNNFITMFFISKQRLLTFS